LFRNQKFKYLFIAFVAAIVFIADQATKRLVVTHIYFDGNCVPWCGHKELIPGWLRIAPEPNQHGAFGLLGSNTWLLIVMAIIVLVVFWLSFHFGYVIDFIDFYRFPDIWRFTFNVADSCITAGVILLLLSGVTSRRHA